MRSSVMAGRRLPTLFIRLINVTSRIPAILAVEPDGGIKFPRVIQVLPWRLDMQIFNADLREPRGSIDFDDGSARRIQVFESNESDSGNIERNLFPASARMRRSMGMLVPARITSAASVRVRMSMP